MIDFGKLPDSSINAAFKNLISHIMPSERETAAAG